MKIKLVPNYKMVLSLQALDKRESYDDLKTNEALYLKMAPFFIGAKGEDGLKGEDGAVGTGNFLSIVDW